MQFVDEIVRVISPGKLYTINTVCPILFVPRLFPGLADAEYNRLSIPDR